jgi:hypothetical protein
VKTMVEYINQKALELCMKSGMRFMECKRFVMDVAGESRCIGSYDHNAWQLEGIIEENVRFDEDYAEYDRKMKEAGLK